MGVRPPGREDSVLIPGALRCTVRTPKIKKGVWEWGTGHMHQGIGIGMTQDFSVASWDAPRE